MKCWDGTYSSHTANLHEVFAWLSRAGDLKEHRNINVSHLHCCCCCCCCCPCCCCRCCPWILCRPPGLPPSQSRTCPLTWRTWPAWTSPRWASTRSPAAPHRRRPVTRAPRVGADQRCVGGWDKVQRKLYIYIYIYIYIYTEDL